MTQERAEESIHSAVAADVGRRPSMALSRTPSTFVEGVYTPSSEWEEFLDRAYEWDGLLS
jgi:hypothetical protein